MRAMGSRSLAARTVGVGEVSLSRAACRGVDAGDLTLALHAALESGITTIEVAADEDSEKMVGEALRSMRLRDRVLSILRVPAIAHRLGIPTRDTLPERLPHRYLQERVEKILRSTRLEVLPVVALELRATWRSSSAWPEVVGTCARLVHEGKVLEYAGHIETIEDDSAELANEAWLSALSVPFSLCERAAAPIIEAARREGVEAPGATEPAAAGALTPSPNDDLLASAAARDPHIAAALAASMSSTALIAPAHATAATPKPRNPQVVFARRPLAGGALAGTLGPGAKLRPKDDRALDAATLERIAIAVAKLARFVKRTPPAALSCEAAKLQLERNRRPEHIDCMTLAELALRFVLDAGAVALPRLHHREHLVETMLASAAPPLPRDVVDNLDI